jgi:hypothetical protein
MNAALLEIERNVALIERLASFEDECRICICHLSNCPSDHRFGDHDVLDGDTGEIGHRDIVG